MMTGTQKRALEALYIAAGQKFGVVVDINKAGLFIHSRTLDGLVNRGFVARSTATNYSITSAGAAKLAARAPAHG